MAADGTGQNETESASRKGGGSLGDLVKVESMIQLAIAIPAGCVIGWLAGGWLDHHFHQGWIAITGLILGAAAGFLQMVTLASKVAKGK